MTLSTLVYLKRGWWALAILSPNDLVFFEFVTCIMSHQIYGIVTPPSPQDSDMPRSATALRFIGFQPHPSEYRTFR